jgi:heme exporter protein A
LIFEAANNFALRVHRLGCRRGSSWLFRGVSFHIPPGKLVWLRGKNGSGKTSLLRLVVGLAQPDEGAIEHGQSHSEDARCPVVYIGHANALKDDLTAMESLQFLMQVQGRAATDDAVVGAMRTLSIHRRRNQFVKTLSQGQRRRVTLSRLALEDSPALWVLDEPFEALDVEGISVLKTLIGAHVMRGGSVLMTSHIPVESSTVPVNTLDLDTLVAA